MRTTFLLLVWASALVTLLRVAPCQAAPRKPINTYDQRQDGKLNVHAKLENFLIVVAPSSSSANADLSGLLQNDLVAQALDLKNIASRVAGHPEDSEISAKLEDSDDTAADVSDSRIDGQKSTAEKTEKEPETTVQLIAIVQREIPDVVASTKSSQPSLKSEKNLKSVVVGTETKGETLDASETSKKIARSLAKVSDESSVSKLPPRANDQQAPLENKVLVIGLNDRGNSVGPADGKPQELNDQRVPLENKVLVIGLNDRGNSVGPAEREPQELKLLGGAIENCGPDRFRDSTGVCQSRSEA